jgi:hypothetical protein
MQDCQESISFENCHGVWWWGVYIKRLGSPHSPSFQRVFAAQGLPGKEVLKVAALSGAGPARPLFTTSSKLSRGPDGCTDEKEIKLKKQGLCQDCIANTMEVKSPSREMDSGLKTAPDKADEWRLGCDAFFFGWCCS